MRVVKKCDQDASADPSRDEPFLPASASYTIGVLPGSPEPVQFERDNSVDVHYTLKDIRRELPRAYVDRGIDYHARGRVLNLSSSDRGRLVSALVRGSGAKPYKVIAKVFPERGGGVRIIGQCTCPVSINCKHVAAVLVAAMEQHAAGQGETVSDPALEAWFARLRTAVQGPSQPRAAAQLTHRLMYVIEARAASLVVRVLRVRLRKQGGYADVSGYDISNILQRGTATSFIDDTDVTIARWLSIYRSPTGTPLEIVLHEADAMHHMLEKLSDSGRCFWQTLGERPLQRGAPRHGILDWAMAGDGTQRLSVRDAETKDVLIGLASAPPWYVDVERAQCGLLMTGLPDAQAAALIAAPPLTPDVIDTAMSVLQRNFDHTNLPLPKTLKRTRQTDVQPVPCLRFFVGDIPFSAMQGWGYASLQTVPVPLARLSFDYDGCRISPFDENREVTRSAGDTLVVMQRQRALEADALAQLTTHGFIRLDDFSDLEPEEENVHDFTMSGDDREYQLLEFARAVVPQLRVQGWRIEFDDNYTLQVVEDGGAWYAEIGEERGSDWFSLDLGIDVEGKRLSLLPLLVKMLRDGTQFERLLSHSSDDDAFMLRLDDGRHLPLPIARVRHIIQTLIELYSDDGVAKDGRMRMSKLHAAQVAELERGLPQGAVQWRGGEKLRELGHKLRSFEGLAQVAPPQDFTATLRGYQQRGLDWMQFLREYEFGGILADDMGLGKTVQALAHIAVEKAQRRLNLPCLVVAPTSLVTNWQSEAERFAPHLSVLTLHGPERKERFADLKHHDIVLTTYPLLARDGDILGAQNYHLLLLDEAQMIKNPKAKSAQTVQRLRARHRLCLTGTPMENHLGELWSLFNFLMPGLLGDEARFRRLYRTPIEKRGDEERRMALVRRVAPFMLRRTKDAVAKELPPKTEMTRVVEIEGAQRDLYESIRLAMHEKVRREIQAKGLARSHIVILEALLKLRQVCCDPRLLKKESARAPGSAKLELLTEILPELIEEGRRILLFSQFTSMLALIEDELEKLAIPYVKLIGQTKDRKTPINAFQSGKVPLFLISLKAGGTGLNLTAADTVIHYDPWWNPAVENQATDRAHRIGQDKPVFVYRLITRGTVEEKIIALQERKRALAAGLFEGKKGAGGQLTADDLNVLFEPLG